MGLASVGTNTYVTRRQTCPCRMPCAEPHNSEAICPVVSIFVSSQTAALPMTMISIRFVMPKRGCA